MPKSASVISIVSTSNHLVAGPARSVAVTPRRRQTTRYSAASASFFHPTTWSALQIKSFHVRIRLGHRLFRSSSGPYLRIQDVIWALPRVPPENHIFLSAGYTYELVMEPTDLSPTNLRHWRAYLLFHNLPAIPAPESGFSYWLLAFANLNQPIQVGLAPAVAGDAV